MENSHFAQFCTFCTFCNLFAYFAYVCTFRSQEVFSCSLALLLPGQSHLGTLLCPEMASWLSTSQIGFLHDGNSEFYIENDEDVGSFPNNFISEHLRRAALILTLTSKCPKIFSSLDKSIKGQLKKQ